MPSSSCLRGKRVAMKGVQKPYQGTVDENPSFEDCQIAAARGVKREGTQNRRNQNLLDH